MQEKIMNQCKMQCVKRSFDSTGNVIMEEDYNVIGNDLDTVRTNYAWLVSYHKKNEKQEDNNKAN